MRRISVGIDIAKETHWVTAIDADGVVLLDRGLLNTAARPGRARRASSPRCSGQVRVGIDVLGGIAGLAAAMLAETGFALVHVPGLAVNRARQGTVGGENKSDPRDARTIAEQVRTRSDLRPVEAGHRDRPRDQASRRPAPRPRRGADPAPCSSARSAGRHLPRPGSHPRPHDQGAAAPAHPLCHARPSCAGPAGSASSVTCRPPAACPSSRSLADRALAAAAEQTHRRPGRAHDRAADP